MSRPDRRSFLAAVAGAGVGAVLPTSCVGAIGAPLARRTIESQRILVLGGTGFLGPHFVRSALARGHRVTLFHRGKTGVGLFPELEHLKGDREQGDLQALQGREFDAVIDTSGYVPAHVEATARLCAPTAKHYQFISSVSVYGAFGVRPADVAEDSAVAAVGDGEIAAVRTIKESMSFYGALKARCEAAARAAMGDRVAVIRPGLIVGPGDTSDRFTWWPVRIDRGGEVLAPGDPDALVQFLDVRDLGDWMVHVLEQRLGGVWNAAGFAGAVSMQEVLDGCKCATANAVTLTWASEEFLAAREVGPWMTMPLWIPRERRSRIVNARAIADGLRFRPIADTIRDTLQWARTERGERPFARTGLPPEREQQLLAAWHGRGK